MRSLAAEAKAVDRILEAKEIRGMLLENFQEVICDTATRLFAIPPGCGLILKGGEKGRERRQGTCKNRCENNKGECQKDTL